MDVTLALVTVISLVLATAMSIVAWRLARDERVRAEARATADDEDDLGAPVATPAEAWTAPPARRARLAVAVALAVFAAGSAASITVVFGEARRLDRRGGQPRAADGATLELLSLSEDREANRVVVRGVVRNPASGSAIDRLTAVVLLIGENGAVLARARAAVTPALGPGAEAPFEVTSPDGDGVERFRISFQAGDRVVPHVDERDRKRGT